jgi:hypothetical protein
MGAHFGNKYALGNKGGGNPKFKNPEDFQAAISEYFESGVKIRKVIVGKGENEKVVEVPVPTITGLVLHCGFCDRSSFYDYEKKKEFAYTIKRARSFIELEYEEMLHKGNCTGAIFALKNFDWTDKLELEVTDVIADRIANGRKRTTPKNDSDS